MDLKLVLTECIEMTYALHQDRGQVMFDIALDGDEKRFGVYVGFEDQACMYQEAGDTVEEALTGLHRSLRNQCQIQRDALAPWTKPR